MRIAAYCIALNEEPHAARWADTTKDADVALVAVDTASTDDTAGVLRSCDVGVLDVDYPDGFRYDHARQRALEALPADVDVCVVVDMDETLDDGFIDQVRAEWERHPFDSGMVWYSHNGATPTKHLRVHARVGYEWRRPCHETLMWVASGHERRVDLDVSMQHRQVQKDRSHRLNLLRLAIQEDPDDARMWHYLARDSLHAGDREGALAAAVAMLDLPGGWPPERAAACRYAAAAAPDHAAVWLTRGTIEAPLDAEAWRALTDYHYQRGDWTGVWNAATTGMACPPTDHYLTDATTLGWWLLDRAALAAYHLGAPRTAAELGARALAGAPADPQLAENLTWYQQAGSIGK